MKHLLWFALGLCCLAPVRGAVRGALTVEWLTCEAEVVAVGKLSSVKSVKGPGDVIYEDAILTVSETIKGAPAKQLTFCYRHLSGGQTGWMTSKGDLLVFLTIHKAPYDESRLHLSTDSDYETRLHGMLMPANEHVPLSIIELSAPERFVFDGRFNQLTNQEQILTAARDAAKALASRQASDAAFKPASRDIDIPFGTPAWKLLYAGSWCFLRAPEFMFPAPKK